MKAKTLVAVMLALLTSAWAAGPVLASDNPFNPKLPFTTAVIKYELKGFQKGSEVLYIDGQRQAKHSDTVTNIMGSSQPKKAIHITTPDKSIEVDLTTRQAKATGNLHTYMAQEFDKLSPPEKANVRKNVEKLGTGMAQAMMGEKPQVSEGVFKGKPVSIAKVGTMTTYTWKDTPIALKTQGAMMGMQVDMEATSIETGLPIKGEVFEVPAGINVVFDQQADAMQKRMAANMIAMLKDPDYERKTQQQGGPMGAMMQGMMGGAEADEEDAPQQPKGKGPAGRKLPPEVERMIKERQQQQGQVR